MRYFTIGLTLLAVSMVSVKYSNHQAVISRTHNPFSIGKYVNPPKIQFGTQSVGQSCGLPKISLGGTIAEAKLPTNACSDCEAVSCTLYPNGSYACVCYGCGQFPAPK